MDLNKLKELSGIESKPAQKLDEGTIGGMQGIANTVSYREQTDLDKWLKLVLEADEADTKTCPECHGKGGKKYRHEDEMEWDSCRTCDGKKTVAASYEESADAELEDDAVALTEHVVGDLQNGYGQHHSMTKNYNDAFPTGAVSNVVDDIGPSSSNQGDNPMQKSMKADVIDDEEKLAEAKDVHAELVHKYRKHITE